MSLDFYLEDEDEAGRRRELFHAEITDNLGRMADSAAVYWCLWEPRQQGVRFAGDLIPYLESGLARLRDEPERFRQMDPPHGDYDALVRFVESVLGACREHPWARVNVSA
jgi:hypothetical protein